MVDRFLKLDASNDKYSVLGFNHITVEELQNLINALPNNKSGSIDNWHMNTYNMVAND